MISKKTARKLMIEKQGLSSENPNPVKNHVYRTIDSLGCLQIDTINVIERAHYLTLWSRLGNYEKTHLESLAYKDRKIFEYWAHAACYVPTKDYRYYIKSMEERKKELKKRLLNRTGKGDELLKQIIERIKDEGPLASKDFQSKKKRKGGWWNRKDEKIAMDYLYGAGILSISHRDNFQRYYDLTENIIPNNVDRRAPEESERVWFFIKKTLECLGVIRAKEAREYYQHHAVKLDKTSAQIDKILKEKTQKIEVEGEPQTYYCLSEDFSRLEQIDDDFDYSNLHMLVYFDNFMWNRERIKTLFNFDSKLEIYIPKEDRVFGYYHLPILWGDEIVARIEPKMDRSEKKLLIRGYWKEPGFEETEEYNDKLMKRLDEFAYFHGTKNIEWVC